MISLGLCLEIYSQSLIPRQPGILTFVFRLNLWLGWISGNLMLQVLTAYLFGLSGASLRRSSIPMPLAQLAAVSSSLRVRCSIKTGRILKKAQSFTFRELLPVSLSMKAFAEYLKAQTVTWLTDNQNFVWIVYSGSKTPALQELAMDIYRSCLLNGVNIDMQWIPRDLNIVWRMI